jgi:serine/threonine protein kinase
MKTPHPQSNPGQTSHLAKPISEVGTRLGGFAPAVRSSTNSSAVTRPQLAPGECPVCGKFGGDQPFCSRDGQLLKPTFAVSERYQVEQALGFGTSAFVFGARHNKLGKPVAIKLLRKYPEHAGTQDGVNQRMLGSGVTARNARFLREARTASALHHENIVDVTDFGEDANLGVPFLVMERLRGETLASAMHREAPMAWRRVISILLQVCRGLTVAHNTGLIHRDLKPQNIFLEQSSGRELVKLCDFGLSRFAAEDDRLTMEGEMIGTPAYAAPEQIRGDGDADHRADLYALGCTAYEMLSKSLPHHGETSIALLAAKLTQPAIRLSQLAPVQHVPPALIALVMQCLEAEPGMRPESAAVIEENLMRILASAPTMVASSDPRSLIGQMAGSYRITDLIGCGAAGAVYQAEHPMIGTKVAVKVLLPEAAAFPGMSERFVNEARTSGQIGSPHIPQVFDFGTLPTGQAFAVMELLKGETVAQRLANIGQFSVAEVGIILGQVASALEKAHAAGVVHRDVKPDNLFLCRGESGEVIAKVLDFGVARMATPLAAKLTVVGGVVGTVIYAPPEQLMAQEISPLVDVYALGVTAFEMLTGDSPYDGEFGEVLAQKTAPTPPSAGSKRSDLPTRVVADVAAMMATRASGRPSSMGLVAQQFASWVSPSQQGQLAAAGKRAASAVNARGTTQGFATLGRAAPAASPTDLMGERQVRVRTGIPWAIWAALAVVLLTVGIYLGTRSGGDDNRAASTVLATPTPTPTIVTPTVTPLLVPDAAPAKPAVTAQPPPDPVTIELPTTPAPTRSQGKRPPTSPAAGRGKIKTPPPKTAKPRNPSDVIIADPYGN